MKTYKWLRENPVAEIGDTFEATNQMDVVLEYISTFFRAYQLEKIGYIEEVKEPTRWRPKEGEVYYYIWSNFDVLDSIFWEGNPINENFWPTRESAEHARDKMRELFAELQKELIK